MGGGIYSAVNARMTADASGYATKSTHDIFKQKSINNAMNPHGIQLRESRDSDEHPNSLAIIIGLDVTGSMGSVPHFLVKEGLTDTLENILGSGEKDPQVLFLGIGDHECDSSPLQVGQFESSDPLLDKWLTDVYLEGGGGGNMGESYMLAWYFAAFHTSTDCFEKRKRKGFLFTVGDEPVLPSLPAKAIQGIMGDGQYETLSSVQLLEKARDTYNVFHIHVKQTGAGSRQTTIDGWQQLMGDNLIVVSRSTDIAEAMTKAIASIEYNGPECPLTETTSESDSEEIL